MHDTYKLKHISDGTEFDLENISSIIGRSDSSDLSYDDTSMSREHARLQLKADGVYVQDLHSTNGTFINDREIEEESLLKVGDIVKFGEVEFCLQYQNQDNPTVIMRTVGGNKKVTSSIFEAEEDEDSTVILETYTMPPGWADFGDYGDELGTNEMDKRKQEAIDNYIKKASQALQGRPGLALIFFVEKKPPTIKIIYVKDEKLNWQLGRSPECEVCYDNPAMSFNHAKIEYKDDSWIIEDNGSTNGIWKNNRRISQLKIDDNDSLKIGPVEIKTKLIPGNKPIPGK